MRDGFIKVAALTPEIKLAQPRHNAETTVKLMREASGRGVKLAVFPELGLCGITCADLFFQETLIEGCMDALAEILEESAAMDMITVIGMPLRVSGRLFNCAVVLSGGRILGVIPKSNLQNYGEFFEARYFAPADVDRKLINVFEQEVDFGTDILFTCMDMEEYTFAVEICEDVWMDIPPSARHTRAGAAIILNLSAGCEVTGKAGIRRDLVIPLSAKEKCGYVYVSAGKGESTTDMVFPAHNIIAENGRLLIESPPFGNGVAETEIDVKRLAFERARTGRTPRDGGYARVYFAQAFAETQLTRGVSSDPFYDQSGNVEETALQIQTRALCARIERAKAKALVVGVSGGIDSALALIIAVRAAKLAGLTEKAVKAVSMPGLGTGRRTHDNAKKLIELLHADFSEIDISGAVERHFADIGHDPEIKNVVYENAQARERTQILFDLANEYSGLVIGTGDMSELALGFATYNGDHMASYGVNAGVPKTLIRHIVKYCAGKYGGELSTVLTDIAETPVSPELLPGDQSTEDIVGPYELHDFFLYYMVRWGFGPQKLLRLAKYAFTGQYGEETIKGWLTVFLKRFFANQFKRSCVPDGPKVCEFSLSPRGDWRMPSDVSAELWLSEL